jgi:hypothetical protein
MCMVFSTLLLPACIFYIQPIPPPHRISSIFRIGFSTINKPALFVIAQLQNMKDRFAVRKTVTSIVSLKANIPKSTQQIYSELNRFSS